MKPIVKITLSGATILVDLRKTVPSSSMTAGHAQSVSVPQTETTGTEGTE